MTTSTADTFKALHAELESKKNARRAGAAISDAEIRALAEQVLAAYNDSAREVAKRFGRRPVLATLKRFL